MGANDPRTSVDSQLRKLQVSTAHFSPLEAAAAFSGLHDEMSRVIAAAKPRLLATDFDWTDEQRSEAQWIYVASHRIASLGLHLSESIRRKLGEDDTHSLAIVALTLLYFGEAMKWELAGGTRFPRDYRGIHAIMRHALATGRRREPVDVRAGGEPRACNIESLYFRALLLARFASGVLTARQFEILDEWIWMWTPALKGAAAHPSGSSALRADLDGAEGLQRGPREGPGASLYLQPAPLDAAFRTLLAHFHEGRIVPERGCTAAFRVEEHIAVLDLIRRGLRAAMRGPMARAPREVVDRPVELLVGLAQISAAGFTSAAPPAAAVGLATHDGARRGRSEGELRSALDGIYEPNRRIVNLTNVSESGFGLEGSDADCGMLAVGELVAARLAPNQPLSLGRVMRCVPAAIAGRVIVGVSRISSAAKPIDVIVGAGDEARAVSMLFVPGDDNSGSRDAYLVPERTYDESPSLEVHGAQNVYSMRFNRVRERGRGWVLAGFEIESGRPVSVP